MLERGATDGKMKKTEGRRISSEGVVGNAVGTWIRLRGRKGGLRHWGEHKSGGKNNMLLANRRVSISPIFFQILIFYLATFY